MLNRVVLTGRLTRDPELRYTGNGGVAVCSFRLAVDRQYRNHQGEREADFINCTVWRKSAENFANFTHKGSLVGIDGRLTSSSYESQGQRIYRTEVTVDNFALLDPRNGGNRGGARPMGNDQAGYNNGGFQTGNFNNNFQGGNNGFAGPQQNNSFANNGNGGQNSFAGQNSQTAFTNNGSTAQEEPSQQNDGQKLFNQNNNVDLASLPFNNDKSDQPTSSASGINIDDEGALNASQNGSSSSADSDAKESDSKNPKQKPKSIDDVPF